MIKRTNRMLVIIPFDLPWEHTADYTHQTAHILAKQHTVICYMQKEARSVKEYLAQRRKPILWKKYARNLFLYYPLYVIPLRRFQFVEKLNTYINIILMKTLHRFMVRPHTYHKKLLWLFYPEYVYMIRAFGPSYVSLYDCVDYHAGSSPYRERRDNIIKWERKLISKCSYFFVNSQTLYDIHKRKRNDVVLVSQGFRLDTFRASSKKTMSFDTKGKPIIGYIGGMNYRLDFGLLDHLAARNPQFRFVLVGPIQENDSYHFRTIVQPQLTALFRHPNVMHIPYIAKDQIPGMIKQFNVAMIPYDVKLDFNKYCYPMKLFEYFYVGKPVISTPIEELKRFSKYVRIGNTVKDWENLIENLLSRPWPLSFQKEQKRLATENSWDNKISQISGLIN